MTSLMPSLIRMSAGSSTQTAPATAAAAAISTSISQSGPSTLRPTPAAAHPPMSSWPLTPRFHIRARNENATETAAMSSGVASAPIWVMSSFEPNDASQASPASEGASRPVSWRMSAAKTRASRPPAKRMRVVRPLDSSSRRLRRRLVIGAPSGRTHDRGTTARRAPHGVHGPLAGARSRRHADRVEVPAHEQPDRVAVDRVAGELADDAAVVHHDEPVDDLGELVEVVGDEEHPRSPGTGVQDEPPHVLRRV